MTPLPLKNWHLSSRSSPPVAMPGDKINDFLNDIPTYGLPSFGAGKLITRT